MSETPDPGPARHPAELQPSNAPGAREATWGSSDAGTEKEGESVRSWPKPDYEQSIVNLTRSLIEGLGNRAEGDGPYAPLAMLDPRELGAYRAVVLVVVDGLGYDRVQANLGFAREHLRGRLTTVYPTTTASAVTSFLTGVAPQQHAVTGWHMWLKEVGSVVASLPFHTRSGGVSLRALGVKAQEVFSQPSIFGQLDVPTFFVQRTDLVNTPYTVAHKGPARAVGYGGLPQFFKRVGRVLRANRRCYVHAYWPDLDRLSHMHGAASQVVAHHWRELQEGLERLSQSFAGDGVLFLVSADHGFIDIAPPDVLELDHHPVLRDCLLAPLCGEQRAPFCYVRPGHRHEFESYVREEMAPYCEALPAEELVARNFLGRGEVADALWDRLGHYALLMKGRHVLRDVVAGESGPRVHVGVHGGLSAAELYVPLVVVRT